jgi:hypothetical protein
VSPGAVGLDKDRSTVGEVVHRRNRCAPIGGVPVRVISAERTVADCFKFRNQIGTQVAVEALRDAWRSRKLTADTRRLVAWPM